MRHHRASQRHDGGGKHKRNQPFPSDTHPDRARGTAKFRLTLEEGRALVSALRGNISGLCQPTYVVDIPGGHGKASAQDVTADGALPGRWNLRDFRGQTHDYTDNDG